MIAAPKRLCCGERHYGPVCPDLLVMCCLCFERFPVELLAKIDGVPTNVCGECFAREAKRI